MSYLKELVKPVVLSSIMLGVLASASVSVAEEKKFKETDIQEIAINLANQTLEGNYQLIKIDALKKMIDSGEDFVLVDAHPRREFVVAYIDGAINFGFQSKRSGEWDKDLDIDGGASQEQFRSILGDDLNKKIVVYCGFTKCGRSHSGAWWARFMGYKNVYRAPGGITAWIDAGYPFKKIEK